MDIGWKFHGSWISSWPFCFINVIMAWHHTSLTTFSIQQSWCFEGVCVPLCLMNCLFLVPDSQPTATELFQSPLYGFGTIFCSISHLLHHFPSSALAWRHTSSNSAITIVVLVEWHWFWTCLYLRLRGLTYHSSHLCGCCRPTSGHTTALICVAAAGQLVVIQW